MTYKQFYSLCDDLYKLKQELAIAKDEINSPATDRIIDVVEGLLEMNSKLLSVLYPTCLGAFK